MLKFLLKPYIRRAYNLAFDSGWETVEKILRRWEEMYPGQLKISPGQMADLLEEIRVKRDLPSP